MSRTFLKLDAGDGRREMFQTALERWHGALLDAGVTFDVLAVSGPRDANGEVSGPAIKVRGHKAMATIRITSLKERAKLVSDVEILVDGDECDTWSDEEFLAIADHEWTHIELTTDKDGAVVRDDLDRPKLRMRQHDHEIGVFTEVAKRHKENAAETKAVAAVGKEFVVQGVFPGF